MIRYIAGIIILSMVLSGCGSSSTPTETAATSAETTVTTTDTPSETTTAETTTTEDTTEETTAGQEKEPDIVLIAGKKNEYSEIITLNEKTDAELSRLAFFVPVGKYSVENIGSHMTQVSIYSRETTVNDDGIEEPAASNCVLIDAGNTAEIEIPEDFYIYISDPTEIALTVIE